MEPLESEELASPVTELRYGDFPDRIQKHSVYVH